MSLTSKLLVLRATAAVRRSERDRRRTLERELLEYSSPAERADLEATFERYPTGQTRELRDILATQEMQRLQQSHARRWPSHGTGC